MDLIPDVSTLKEQFNECGRSVFKFYLIRCVGQQVSTVPNWSQPAVHCTCRNCAKLNRFLQSPTVQVYDVALPERECQHLHEKLDGSNFKGTDLTRRPQDILVVTKNDNGQRAKHEAWLQRCKAAHAELQTFDQSLLREMLGGDAYEDLVTMRHIITDPRSVPDFLPKPTPLPEISTQPMQGLPTPLTEISIQATHGQKRKAEDELAAQVRQKPDLTKIEVVDLCDSD